MTPTKKAEEISKDYHFLDGEPKNDDAMQARVFDGALKMYEWTKEQVVEKTCNLMQHWILEHDYVDIMELEDYVKQKMEDEI